MAPCPTCGGPVTHAKSGRPPTYCSTACRVAAHRQRAEGVPSLVPGWPPSDSVPYLTGDDAGLTVEQRFHLGATLLAEGSERNGGKGEPSLAAGLKCPWCSRSYGTGWASPATMAKGKANGKVKP